MTSSFAAAQPVIIDDIRQAAAAARVLGIPARNVGSARTCLEVQ